MKASGVYKTKIMGSKTTLPNKIIEDFGLSDGGIIDWIVEKDSITINFQQKEMKLSQLVWKIDMGETNHKIIDEIVNE